MLRGLSAVTPKPPPALPASPRAPCLCTRPLPPQGFPGDPVPLGGPGRFPSSSYRDQK